jgi:hypothetical protein
MKREPQLSVFVLCVGLALLTFLVSASSAAAQANTDTNGQQNNGPTRHDDDRDDRGDFAVKQGPGTNTGNCPALPPPTDQVSALTLRPLGPRSLKFEPEPVS